MSENNSNEQKPAAVLPSGYEVVLSILDDLNDQITKAQEQVKTGFEKLRNQSIALTAQAALTEALKKAVIEKSKV